jgi:hypothetical protein
MARWLSGRHSTLTNAQHYIVPQCRKYGLRVNGLPKKVLARTLATPDVALDTRILAGRHQTS